MTPNLDLAYPERIEVSQTVLYKTIEMNIAALATQKGLEPTGAKRCLITTDAQVASGIRTEDTIKSERHQQIGPSAIQVFSRGFNMLRRDLTWPGERSGNDQTGACLAKSDATISNIS